MGKLDIFVKFVTHWDEGTAWSRAKLDLVSGTVSDIEAADNGAEYEHLIKQTICLIYQGVESDDVLVKADEEEDDFFVASMDDLSYLRRIAMPIIIDKLCDRLGDSASHATDNAVPEVATDAIALFAAVKELLASLESPLRCNTFRMSNDRKNPHGYTVEAGRSGDDGIYDEMRVSILNPEGDCVGDALIGLTPEGEPRVLVTAGGDGDGEHPVAVYPLRDAEVAVEYFDSKAYTVIPGSSQ